MWMLRVPCSSFLFVWLICFQFWFHFWSKRFSLQVLFDYGNIDTQLIARLYFDRSYLNLQDLTVILSTLLPVVCIYNDCKESSSFSVGLKVIFFTGWCQSLCEWSSSECYKFYLSYLPQDFFCPSLVLFFFLFYLVSLCVADV